MSIRPLIIPALVLTIGLGVALLFFLLRPSWLPFRTANKRMFNNPAVIQQVQEMAEIVTVKYVMEKVIVLEDVKWYGENRLLMIAHGTVKAGVDLRRLEAGDVQITERTIRLTLPPATLTDVYLDEKRTQVIERTTGSLRSFDKDLEQNGRRQAVEDLRRAAKNGGILQEARERARSQVTSLLKLLGFEEVHVNLPQ